MRFEIGILRPINRLWLVYGVMARKKNVLFIDLFQPVQSKKRYFSDKHPNRRYPPQSSTKKRMPSDISPSICYVNYFRSKKIHYVIPTIHLNANAVKMEDSSPSRLLFYTVMPARKSLEAFAPYDL